MALYDAYGNLIPPASPVAAQVPRAAPPTLNFDMPVGYTPDEWANLIAGNSNYLAWKLSAASRQDVAQANRRAALRALAIRYGGLPPNFSDQYGDLDQATLDIATNNPFSAYNREGKKYSEDTFNAARGPASRGMYYSGELPYELGQSDYAHASDLYDLGQEFANAYVAEIQKYGDVVGSLRTEQIQAIRDAATDTFNKKIRLGSGTDATTPTTPPNTVVQTAPAHEGGKTSGGAAPNSRTDFGAPASGSSGGATAAPQAAPSPHLAGPGGAKTMGRGSMVWDVNSPSTNWAVNAANAGGGGVVITEGDPESAAKFTAASESHTPVSIQINGSADDTPATLAAKIAQAKQNFPGASITLDLESPNFRGGPGSPGWNNMAGFAAEANAAAGDTPLTITTESVTDFNYGAWASNQNTTFAPQAYWGNGDPKDVQQAVDQVTAQGIDPSRVVPVVVPGQSRGNYQGPVSVFGLPTEGQDLGGSGFSAQPTATAPETLRPSRSTPSIVGAAAAKAAISSPAPKVIPLAPRATDFASTAKQAARAVAQASTLPTARSVMSSPAPAPTVAAPPAAAPIVAPAPVLTPITNPTTIRTGRGF